MKLLRRVQWRDRPLCGDVLARERLHVASRGAGVADRCRARLARRCLHARLRAPPRAVRGC